MSAQPGKHAGHPKESPKHAQDILLKAGWENDSQWRLVSSQHKATFCFCQDWRYLVNSIFYVCQKEVIWEVPWSLVDVCKVLHSTEKNSSILSNVRLSASVRHVPPFFCYSNVLQPPVPHLTVTWHFSDFRYRLVPGKQGKRQPWHWMACDTNKLAHSEGGPSWKTLCFPPESISHFPHGVLEFPTPCPEILGLIERFPITDCLAIQIAGRASNPYCGMEAVMGGSHLLHHWHWNSREATQWGLWKWSQKEISGASYRYQRWALMRYVSSMKAMHKNFSREVILMMCDV